MANKVLSPSRPRIGKRLKTSSRKLEKNRSIPSFVKFDLKRRKENSSPAAFPSGPARKIKISFLYGIKREDGVMVAPVKDNVKDSILYPIR